MKPRRTRRIVKILKRRRTQTINNNHRTHGTYLTYTETLLHLNYKSLESQTVKSTQTPTPSVCRKKIPARAFGRRVRGRGFLSGFFQLDVRNLCVCVNSHDDGLKKARNTVPFFARNETNPRAGGESARTYVPRRECATRSTKTVTRIRIRCKKNRSVLH